MIDIITICWLCVIGLVISYIFCMTNVYLTSRNLPVRQQLSYYGLAIAMMCSTFMVLYYTFL